MVQAGRQIGVALAEACGAAGGAAVRPATGRVVLSSAAAASSATVVKTVRHSPGQR
jgi:hypothetical protein